ncbi:MAG TPA: amino acid permease [Caulobacteraceae bacterium]|jgi:APA family basic amino acid/polyamine antiporter
MTADAMPSRGTGGRLMIKKSVDQVIRESQAHLLKRSLGAVNLVLLGIGCIIGAGIYVMTGNAAANFAGPAVMLSFVVAGLACAFAGLCYAELASTMPVAGSAYTYSYTTLGEVFAWTMGWLLVLEYGVAASTVAAGWSGSLVSLLANFHIVIPDALTTSFIHSSLDKAGNALVFCTTSCPGTLVNPAPAGIHFNLLGSIGILSVTALLVLGVSESANVNNVIVLIKVGVLVAFVAMGIAFIHPENWTPFIPANEGEFKYGVPGIFRAASVIFFAYVGFEAVSTAAGEAKNPQRDMPIGILGSLLVCTLIYMAVAAVLTGVVPFRELGNAAPIALAVDRMGIGWFSILIKLGAVAGLTSVMLILTYGQTRVFYAMARDGLLPRVFAVLHDKFRTPWVGTIILGSVIAVLAAFLPIQILGDLVSLGTATAFGIVSLSVMFLRTTRPELTRPFSVPLSGSLLRLPVAYAVATGVVIGAMGFAYYFLKTAWAPAGAVVALLIGGALVVLNLKRRERFWVGIVPVLGIFFALVMILPLIDDVFRKLNAGDPLPAILLGGYAVLGAAIYAFYGVRHSRLAKGEDISEDYAGTEPFESQLVGIRDDHA